MLESALSPVRAANEVRALPDPGRPVPHGWSRMRLDDAADRASGHTPDQGKPEYWNGGIRWVSLADSNRLDSGYVFETEKEISALGIRHSSAVLLPAETVVLSRDAGIGKSAVLASEMAVSQHFIAWKCEEKAHLDPWFLYAWLQLNKAFFERMAVGSTIKTIGLPLFKRLTIDFPPLPEQRRIAEILQAWDEAIEKLEALRATKERRFLALRENLIRRGEAIGVPTCFGEFLTESRIVGADGATAKKITVKLYGLGAVAKENERGGGSANTRYFKRSADQLVYSKLDFLNGAFAIIPPNLDGFETTLDLPAFDVAPSVNAYWILQYLIRPEYYSNQTEMARGQRKARRISPAEFLASRVHLPQRDYQDSVVAVLKTAQQDTDTTAREITALQLQKRGLMQKLLSGEWRVNKSANRHG